MTRHPPRGKVSTHSRPKAAGNDLTQNHKVMKFQLTAARRRLEKTWLTNTTKNGFQLTAARRRLASAFEIIRHGFCFNSQPPEGGWARCMKSVTACACFNSQPPEGGWSLTFASQIIMVVSTHSRPKAAGQAAMRS